MEGALVLGWDSVIPIILALIGGAWAFSGRIINRMDRKFEEVAKRFESIESKIGSVDGRVGSIEKELSFIKGILYRAGFDGPEMKVK